MYYLPWKTLYTFPSLEQVDRVSWLKYLLILLLTFICYQHSIMNVRMHFHKTVKRFPCSVWWCWLAFDMNWTINIISTMIVIIIMIAGRSADTTWENAKYILLLTSSILISPLVEHNWDRGLKIHINIFLGILLQQSCNTEVKILVLRLRQALWWDADKKNVNSFVLKSAQISYHQTNVICMILLVIVCFLTWWGELFKTIRIH